jgi:transcriptional regulator with XRE-family HTH domain
MSKRKLDAEYHQFYEMVGSNIQRLRKARCFTQQELADRVLIGRTSLTNIESGLQHPPLHLLYDISEVLRIPISAFLKPYKGKEYF